MRLLPRIPARAAIITQEPLVVAPGLLGAPLATFRRRAVAFAIDLLLFGLVMGAVFAALSLASLHRDDPARLARLGRLLEGSGDGGVSPVVDLLQLVAERSPGALPCDLAAAAREDRLGEVVAGWGDDHLSLALTAGRTRFAEQENGWLLQLGTDVTLGEFSSVFSWGVVFVAWFTVATRLGRGRTPGKALLRLRVVRLDGRALGWNDAFGRAGGYSGSAATALLGFVQMIWDANRQTLHDRMVGTVVVRASARATAGRR